MKPSLINLGPNLLCAIDTETTGVKPGWNEIIQITALPLDNNFERHEDYRPFSYLIRPEYPERLYENASKMAKKLLREALEEGVSAFAAADAFTLWHESLDLGNGKISPLASNWPFDAAMILEWLSPEQVYSTLHGHYRDVMGICSFLNDRAVYQGEAVPFPRLSLGMIAKRLEIPYDSALLHDSFYDCMLTAKCYKKLMSFYCVNF